jgi:hypothetical protein
MRRERRSLPIEPRKISSNYKKEILEKKLGCGTKLRKVCVEYTDSKGNRRFRINCPIYWVARRSYKINKSESCYYISKAILSEGLRINAGHGGNTLELKEVFTSYESASKKLLEKVLEREKIYKSVLVRSMCPHCGIGIKGCCIDKKFISSFSKIKKLKENLINQLK